MTSHKVVGYDHPIIGDHDQPQSIGHDQPQHGKS
jgi:hypothetical protein